MDFFFLRHVTKPMIKFKIANPRPWDLGQDLDSLLQETGMMFQQLCGERGKDPITRRPGFFPTCPGRRKKHVLLLHRPWCIKYHCLRLKFHFGVHSTSPANAFILLLLGNSSTTLELMVTNSLVFQRKTAIQIPKPTNRAQPSLNLPTL